MRRLKAVMEARKSGDPVAIGRASQQVIALGLVQMAKIRLDAKEYDQAAKLCWDSLEFEDTAQTRLEIAIASLYARKPADAAQQATSAAELDPQNALVWTIKGEALLRTKDYTEAVSALSRALELKRDAESAYALGFAYLAIGEKQKATEAFSQMLAVTGNHGWSRVLIGRAYQQNLPQEAVVEFQNALQLDPHTPNAHYYWALTLLQANNWGRTPEIRSHLQEELKLNPRHFLANYLLGVFASLEGSRDESDHYLHLADKLDPSLPEIWMYLGLNANARNDRRLAETYLRKAIVLTERDDPQGHLSLRQAYYVLGRNFVFSGKKEEGERLIEKSQELQHLAELQGRAANLGMTDGAVVPDIPETDNRDSFPFGFDHAPTDGERSLGEHHSPTKWPHDSAENTEKQLRTILGSSLNDLATAEALQEKYQLALRHYREARNWDSRIPGLQRNMGLAAYFAGDPAEAIRVLPKVVTEAPGDAHARAVLGLAYFATKGFAKVVRTIAPIADRAMQDPQLGFAWAKSLAETGNKRRAVHALQSLDKSNANLSIESLIQFGKLWQELGESERAAQSFRRALLMDPENADAKCALHLAECP
jgi:tetratricopeptide (TPR) repeat protein